MGSTKQLRAEIAHILRDRRGYHLWHAHNRREGKRWATLSNRALQQVCSYLLARLPSDSGGAGEPGTPPAPPALSADVTERQPRRQSYGVGV